MTALPNAPTPPPHWHDPEGRHLLPDYRLYPRLPRQGRLDIALFIAHLQAHELAELQGRRTSDPTEVMALFDEIESLQEAIKALHERVVALRRQVSTED